MIWLTKRIRTRKGIRLLKQFGINPIVDVGSGMDNFFVNHAKKEGWTITGLELEKGENFLTMKKIPVKTITGLALLWHIDINKFFSTCKEWNTKRIILIQGNNKFEPITRMYSIGHKHKTNKTEEIVEIAKNNNYKSIYYKQGILWNEFVFEKR